MKTIDASRLLIIKLAKKLFGNKTGGRLVDWIDRHPDHPVVASLAKRQSEKQIRQAYHAMNNN